MNILSVFVIIVIIGEVGNTDSSFAKNYLNENKWLNEHPSVCKFSIMLLLNANPPVSFCCRDKTANLLYIVLQFSTYFNQCKSELEHKICPLHTEVIIKAFIGFQNMFVLATTKE